MNLMFIFVLYINYQILSFNYETLFFFLLRIPKPKGEKILKADAIICMWLSYNFYPNYEFLAIKILSTAK